MGVSQRKLQRKYRVYGGLASVQILMLSVELLNWALLRDPRCLLSQILCA